MSSVRLCVAYAIYRCSATGEITWTTMGPYDADSAAIKTAMDSENAGAATVGTSTTDYQVVYIGQGKVMIYKSVRTA